MLCLDCAAASLRDGASSAALPWGSELPSGVLVPARRPVTYQSESARHRPLSLRARFAPHQCNRVVYLPGVPQFVLNKAWSTEYIEYNRFAAGGRATYCRESGHRTANCRLGAQSTRLQQVDCILELGRCLSLLNLHQCVMGRVSKCRGQQRGAVIASIAACGNASTAWC